MSKDKRQPEQMAFHLTRLAETPTPISIQTPVEEPEYPDPDAPWYEKINPCHINHIYALDKIQAMFEALAPACQCCAGVRIFVLFIATLLLGAPNFVTNSIAGVLIFVVMLAIFFDVLKRIRDAES